jgi:hypothetical protein
VPEENLTDAPETAPEGEEGQPEPDTFPRAYVEDLRRENAGYRDRAKRAEELAREVFTLRVSALGKLADATDLDFDEALLDDAAALKAAVDELVARKPHLADRRPIGDVDQGARLSPEPVNLASLVRGLAG